MPTRTATEIQRVPRDYRLLAMLLVLPVLMSLASVWILDHAKAHKSLFTMSNLVGPTTKSLLDGGGLTACTEDMGTLGNPVCFHAARMPMTAMVVALGIRLFGDRYIPVALFKTALLLLPMAWTIWLVWRALPCSRWRRMGMALLLLAPFGIPAFLADTANILVEEGYSYSFLAVAVALLFFGRMSSVSRSERVGWKQALWLGLALDGLYLSKSSMLPAVIVLAAGFFLLERRRGLRVLVTLLVAAAPIGWAIHQHHASRRYSAGTSFDGMNLHKGNNAEFPARYPPRRGDTLDRFDPELNRGLRFGDEWSFNDYHERAAMEFVRTHPRETLEGAAKKLYVIFFSLEKYGSTASHGVTRWMEIAGLAAFRLMLWAGMGFAAYGLARPAQAGDRRVRAMGGIFLALVAACALPYVAGFAYTRHISVLIYPAALMCCRLLGEDGEESMLAG
jgi:hypothetical protein